MWVRREDASHEIYDYILLDPPNTRRLASIQVLPNGSAGYWFIKGEKATASSDIAAAKKAVLAALSRCK